MRNTDPATVDSFGREWTEFSQSTRELSQRDRLAQFDGYFAIFPWDTLPKDPVGADIGCGSGRWAMLVAPRVGRLYAIDPSEQALSVARRNLADHPNVTVLAGSANDLPVAADSLDFAYCLGVLHHVPDTPAALRAIVERLKPGAPLLIYLYYALDNRPGWFRALWRATNVARLAISRMPAALRMPFAWAIAAAIYWPLARSASFAGRFGCVRDTWPLCYYRDKSFYVMRTDAYDRFCTPLEKRFTRLEIERMMHEAGLERVVFSERMPHWCAVGFRAR